MRRRGNDPHGGACVALSLCFCCILAVRDQPWPASSFVRRAEVRCLRRRYSLHPTSRAMRFVASLRALLVRSWLA